MFPVGTHPNAPTMTKTNPTWINALVVVGSVMFCLCLAVAAIFAPQWRVLHFFQALPYLAVILLARRQNAWGFGAGVFTAVFWNVLLLFRSPVGAQSLPVLESLVHGHVQQPDVLLQLFAACGHFLIIIACLAGFLRIRPAGRGWGQFAAGGILAISYLLIMVFTVGPAEGAQHIKQALGF